MTERNAATEAVVLWLDTYEDTYNYFMEAARGFVADYPDDKEEQAAQMADYIRNEMEKEAPDLSPSVYADLLGAAMQAVDYEEVAAGFLEAARYEAREA